MFEEKFEKYIDGIMDKRYEEAAFYFDILIEKGLINIPDNRIKKLFINWFIQNRELDLQIEDGDIAIEDNDFKIVPDFKEKDVVEFLNWYNKKKNDFLKYLSDEGISAKEQHSILFQTIKNNVVHINEKAEYIQKENSSQSPKKHSFTQRIPYVITFLMSVLVFLFGDNILGRCSKDNSYSNYLTESDINSYYSTTKKFLPHTDTIQIPYLNSKPILDKGLYLQQYYTKLIFGGANIDSVKIGSRKETGEKIAFTRDDNGSIIFDIFEKPYIEFFYKGGFYALEIHYYRLEDKFIAIMSNTETPTLNLKSR